MTNTMGTRLPPTEPTVLIAGAGPTGLTLAVELARVGVSFRLIEAAPGPQPGSRGKGIQPRTLEIFGDLGIADRVLAHGRMAMPMLMTTPDGRVTVGGAEPEELSNRPDIPYTTGLITPEWWTEEALRLRLAGLGGSVEFGPTLGSFKQTDDGVSADSSRTARPRRSPPAGWWAATAATALVGLAHEVHEGHRNGERSAARLRQGGRVV